MQPIWESLLRCVWSNSQRPEDKQDPGVQRCLWLKQCWKPYWETLGIPWKPYWEMEEWAKTLVPWKFPLATAIFKQGLKREEPQTWTTWLIGFLVVAVNECSFFFPMQFQRTASKSSGFRKNCSVQVAVGQKEKPYKPQTGFIQWDIQWVYFSLALSQTVFF